MAMVTLPDSDPFCRHLRLLGLPVKASYTTEEAGRVLGVSARTVSRLIDEVGIDHVLLRSERRPTLGGLRSRFRFAEEE